MKWTAAVQLGLHQSDQRSQNEQTTLVQLTCILQRDINQRQIRKNLGLQFDRRPQMHCREAQSTLNATLHPRMVPCSEIPRCRNRRRATHEFSLYCAQEDRHSISAHLWDMRCAQEDRHSIPAHLWDMRCAQEDRHSISAHLWDMRCAQEDRHSIPAHLWDMRCAQEDRHSIPAHLWDMRCTQEDRHSIPAHLHTCGTCAAQNCVMFSFTLADQ